MRHALCNTVDTRGDERVKLHITFGLFRLCEPVLPAGDEQCGEDGGLDDRLSIRCLNTNISERLMLDSGVLYTPDKDLST
jgi:hypothetical protein